VILAPATLSSTNPIPSPPVTPPQATSNVTPTLATLSSTTPALAPPMNPTHVTLNMTPTPPASPKNPYYYVHPYIGPYTYNAFQLLYVWLDTFFSFSLALLAYTTFVNVPNMSQQTFEIKFSKDNMIIYELDLAPMVHSTYFAFGLTYYFPSTLDF
jgi:hypothetical protein